MVWSPGSKQLWFMTIAGKKTDRKEMLIEENSCKSKLNRTDKEEKKKKHESKRKGKKNKKR